MNRLAMLFLILLRLVIGWHFLVEGFQKVESVYVGETTTNRPFSSVGYFREATGPAGVWVRWLIGDPDAEALARLTVLEAPEGEDPAKVKPGTRLPAAVAKDLNDLLARFTAHHGLNEEQQTQAKAKLDQAADRVALWLTQTDSDDKTPELTRSFPSGDVKRKMATADRIAEYRQKLDELKHVANRNWSFGRDVEKAHYRQMKGEVAALRSGLINDLGEQYDSFRKDLESLLPNERIAAILAGNIVGSRSDCVLTTAVVVGCAVISPGQQEYGPLPAVKDNPLIGWVDWLTRWGLTVIGACLLIGLFTRTNAWLAAGFLFMTYLLMPAWPWLPSVGPSEGNYLFVNKNVVEMLALCVIGTTASGRWFGIDSIISWLFTSEKNSES
jgi:uncharacterized membrane protein YphA (DoxX/SURF4 family)